MSENVKKAKFKLGDIISWNKSSSKHWKKSEIVKVDESNGEYTVEDEYSGRGNFDFAWDLELVKPAEPEITEGSVWVFTRGVDIGRVKVIAIMSNGRPVIEAVDTFCNLVTGQVMKYEADNFIEAYKPYVEEPKTVKLEGWIRVEKYLPTGEIIFQDGVFESEDEAREHNEYLEGTHELIDVIKIEWEGKVE